VGYSTAFSGDLHKGLAYLEQGIAVYKPETGASHSFRFGNNPGLICLTTSAICSWMLGYHQRSLEYADRAMSLADNLDSPSSKIYALFHTGLLHLYKREDEMALKHAAAALEIARNQEYQIWKAVVACLHGAALAGTGRVEDGMAEFNRGLELYTELKTPPVFWPMLLLMKTGVYIQAEKPQDALNIIDEAFAILGNASGNPLLSELYRLKGEVLLMISPDACDQSEELFKKALENAKSARDHNI